MAMVGEDRLQWLVEERQRLAASCSFTIYYPNKQESWENSICHNELALTAYEKHDRAIENWIL